MSLQNIIDDNIEALYTGMNTINKLTPKQFKQASPPYFTASTGKHFRHILDHYSSFLTGLPDLRISYDKRTRDPTIERDLDCCLKTTGQTIDQLEQLKSSLGGDTKVTVTLATSVATPVPPAVTSTIERELVFLQSHTTHHFALIAGILKSLDIPTESNFGVAPSTIIYERNLQCVPPPG